MQRPGAVSHARFMAKCIYIIKIFMTRHQLPRHVLSCQQHTQIERIAKFALFLYAKYFLQAMMPAAAPRLDLEFWEDVQHFQVKSDHYFVRYAGLYNNEFNYYVIMPTIPTIPVYWTLFVKLIIYSFHRNVILIWCRV